MPAKRALLDERRNALRYHILNVARCAFVEAGFAATSMSDIAGRLGGSKGTLYNHFASKTALFAAVVDDECARRLTTVSGVDATAGEHFVEALVAYGVRYAHEVLSDDAVNFTRMVIAAAAGLPELGARFHQAGPAASRMRLADDLQPWVAAGYLARIDCLCAAEHFCSLCTGDLWTQRLLGIIPPPDEDVVTERVREAVRLFLAAHKSTA